MMAQRQVSHEQLDGLTADDPKAVRARGDLRRIHHAMGTRAILTRALKDMLGSGSPARPWRVLELGAGDGTLMLAAARSLAGLWSGVELTLLDRLPLVSPETLETFAGLGWQARTLVVDVLDWAADPGDPAAAAGSPGRWDLIVCNLFLHHFDSPQLVGLLRVIAERSDWLASATWSCTYRSLLLRIFPAASFSY